MLPEARQDKLLVQEVADELVVYDQDRHQVHRLNRTTGLVWRHCDGQTSIADLAALLQSELNLPAEEELVWLALEGLQKAHLLQQPLIRPADVSNMSRRQAVRKLGLAGALSFLLPVVTSIVAPTPAQGASGPQTTRCVKGVDGQRCCQCQNTALCSGTPVNFDSCRKWCKDQGSDIKNFLYGWYCA